MKIVLFLVFVVTFGILNAQKYTQKYDNIDLEQILRNDRLLKSYVNCLLEKGKCTSDGSELKRVLPDALHSGCTKCNERQRSGAKRVFNYLLDNRRDWWNELERKYDPQGSYRSQYYQDAQREGIHL